jgi:hypothetical protein
MILKIFSPKNSAKVFTFFAQTTASFGKHLIITLVFEKNAIFSQLAKIAKSCDHYIDPRVKLFKRRTVQAFSRVSEFKTFKSY